MTTRQIFNQLFPNVTPKVTKSGSNYTTIVGRDEISVRVSNHNVLSGGQWGGSKANADIDIVFEENLDSGNKEFYVQLSKSAYYYASTEFVDALRNPEELGDMYIPTLERVQILISEISKNNQK